MMLNCDPGDRFVYQYFALMIKSFFFFAQVWFSGLAFIQIGVFKIRSAHPVMFEEAPPKRAKYRITLDGVQEIVSETKGIILSGQRTKHILRNLDGSSVDLCICCSLWLKSGFFMTRLNHYFPCFSDRQALASSVD